MPFIRLYICNANEINHMKLPKMKNTIIAIMLLYAFQLNAQIPDSLDIDLPWQIVRLADCENTMGEGPMSADQNIFIHLDFDSLVIDDQGECSLRHKSWSIIDWVGGQDYSYSQLGVLNFQEPLLCEEDLIITYDQLPYTLLIDDVILNPQVDHEFSFSFIDAGDTERVLVNAENSNYEFFAYDHTDSKVCKVNAYVTPCEEDVSLNFPEIVDVLFDGEPYLEITQEMLGIDIIYPCATYDIVIKVKSSINNLLYSTSVGNVVEAKVTVTFSDGNQYVKIINMNVIGEKPPPVPMFIEEKSFSAGEIILLEVWSEEITGVIAWQFQLQFENAEVLDLQPSEMFADIPFNIFESESYIRSLWTPLDALPFDVESNATWFTLALRPTIDGSTIDIFKSEQTPWSLIGIESEDYIFEYEVEFAFNIEPRGVLNSKNINPNSTIDIYPNPSTNRFTISGFELSGSPLKVEIFNLEGKLMQQESFINTNSNIVLDISDLPIGMFILKTQNGKTATTNMISKF